ncbi:uncharacterized protein N7496_005938 [Penicillium cataractarum]|uniref:Uncharacterized protein n=1 Tax=Penicillium cataractarum TaxID=2100454 RepID=A0A9W9S0T5_9EURO|nr:uncharacterized protein N7496_005938 [Penicillium cataractarum]KAJ5369846.1 hypothetical protein N7496_005938 [Penicillium cataractarum]
MISWELVSPTESLPATLPSYEDIKLPPKPLRPHVDLATGPFVATRVHLGILKKLGPNVKSWESSSTPRAMTGHFRRYAVHLEQIPEHVHEGTELVAVDNFGAIYDLSCNGGSQSYCCSGFVPSSYENTDSPKLIGQNGLTKRGSWVAEDPSCLAFMNLAADILGSDVIYAFGTSDRLNGGDFSYDYYQEMDDLCVKRKEVVAHEKAAGVNGAIASAASMYGQGAVGPGITALNIVTKTITAEPVQAVKMIGQWPVVKYSADEPDCSVTYTCKYGKGFDERKKYYASAAKHALEGGRYYCEVDEFPMGSLREAENQAYQVVRFLNGPQNGRQGTDWNQWIQAVYKPCEYLRGEKGPPPITWEFGPFNEGDTRQRNALDMNHFVRAYGFDSQTPGSECWATYTYIDTNGAASTSTCPDQGFRGMKDDPMYLYYEWPPYNNYVDPPTVRNLPHPIFSAQWLKREITRSVL